jgi:P27 family predicted phage terminase small subunit
MPRRKPAAARQNRETRDIGLVRNPSGEVPACPTLAGKEMSTSVRSAWESFWASSIASLVLEADMVALVRLFECYELRERMMRVWLVEPFVLGSTKQVVAHPASREVASLDARIAALEEDFGITPASRLKLGIVLGAAAKSLEEINSAFDNEPEQEDDRYSDPRLRAIEGQATG